MRPSRRLLLLALILLPLAGTGCRGPGPAAAVATEWTIEPWPLPADAQAAQPDLVRAGNGDLLLSWISPQADGHLLRHARFTQGQWQPPRTIAEGADWFVNWADTPHLLASADGALWAQWLRKSASAPYAYDVLLARSADGVQWSAPLTVHDDGTASEHGFVSLWPEGADGIGIAWLDGRNTGGGHGGEHAHAGAAMQLRVARIDATLRKHDEQVLDAMTCDCCQTAAAATANGPLLVWRGRDRSEIRDILAARGDGTGWSRPAPVHADRWQMPACPVNGPALSVAGQQAWVAWYTAPASTPEVRLAHSQNGGSSFAAPLGVDRGEEVQGRVQVAAIDDGAWVAWLREDSEGQSLWLARYTNTGEEAARLQVARLQGRGRATGFPRLLARGDGVRLVWTDVVDGQPVLRGAHVQRTP